jgi:hypothetical protein
MSVILWLWRKFRSAVSYGTDQDSSPALTCRDPDLLAMAEIAKRRRIDMERSLETAFEKARLVLERSTTSTQPIQASDLPASIKARVRAMPDPEQRIRAIVEFKLSTRIQSSHHDQATRIGEPHLNRERHTLRREPMS